MSRERILVVEDDKHISKLVKYNLEKAGFECTVVVTGEEVFESIEKDKVNLIVLDIMLPKMDGFEVCKELRQDPKFANIPVLMLTARGEEIDRIVGLEIGADDYMVKPFSPRELVLRIKAILKRGKANQETQREVLTADNIKIDIAKHKVYINKKEVNFTAMEFKLLVTLVSRRGRVQTRDQLLNDVWDIEADITTRTIDTHIKRLRHKLGRCGKLIETVRGHGYRFNEED